MDDQNKSMNERWAPPSTTPERGYATEAGYGARPASDITPAAPDDTSRRTAEIRSEIDDTRAEMSETIEAIEDRLRPRNVAARAAESVRERTVGAVRQVTGGARQRLSGRDTRYGDDGSNGFVAHLRENPVPATLAAASLAWLAFAGRRSSPRMSPAIYGSTRNGEPFIAESRISMDPEFDEDTSPTGSLARGAGERLERGQQVVSRAASQVRSTGRRAQDNATRVAYEQPLLGAALAAVAGLAIGMTLPVTDRENELMGDARDSLVERGREAVREQAQRVQGAAQEVQRIVTGGGTTGTTGTAGTTAPDPTAGHRPA